MPTNSSDPRFYVQWNWQEKINKPGEEMWVALKYREDASSKGKIFVKDSGKLEASDGFEAFAEDNYLKVGHCKTEIQYVFLAPTLVFGNIHGEGVKLVALNDEGDLSSELNGVSTSFEDEYTLTVWNAETGEVKESISAQVGKIRVVKWLPCGTLLVTSGEDEMIQVCLPLTGMIPITICGHENAITDFAIIERGKNIVSVSKDGSCKLWDVENRSEICELFKGAPINCCCLCESPNTITNHSCEIGENKLPIIDEHAGGGDTNDKIFIAGCDNGDVICIMLESRCELFSLKLESAILTVCAIKPGTFVVGCENGSLYEISSETTDPIIRRWYDTNSPCTKVCSYKDAGFFAAFRDGSCVFYSRDARCKTRLALSGSDGHSINDAACDNRNLLFTACQDASLRKYDVKGALEKYVTLDECDSD